MKKADEAGSQERLVIETFDRKARSYAAGYQGDSGASHSFSIRRQRVYELVGDRRGGTMLDVGCGPGVTVDHFAGSGFEIYGVDISEGMIRECRSRFEHLAAAHFSVGTIERLDFPYPPMETPRFAARACSTLLALPVAGQCTHENRSLLSRYRECLGNPGIDLCVRTNRRKVGSCP